MQMILKFHWTMSAICWEEYFASDFTTFLTIFGLQYLGALVTDPTSGLNILTHPQSVENDIELLR